MAGIAVKVEIDKRAVAIANGKLAYSILEQLFSKGVREICLCPGARNAAFVEFLSQDSQGMQQFRIYHWTEERSAAFFALGRIKATGKPVAVVTTSGTAAGELLPAAMEAYYSGLPLVLVTADRPRRYRGSGAPQSAEQVNIFGLYTPFTQDLEGGEFCNLAEWNGISPCHLNACFEECYQQEYPRLTFETIPHPPIQPSPFSNYELNYFIDKSKYPLVIVGALQSKERAAVAEFLKCYQAPVYFEAQSGLREDPHFAAIRIPLLDEVWKESSSLGYPIDGVLRIGGVPTARIWRDLEERQGELLVCSLSHLPFSGLSWGDLIYGDLTKILDLSDDITPVEKETFLSWRSKVLINEQLLHALFQAEPAAEPSLIHSLSNQVDSSAMVYLGNSLPIREWDLAATTRNKHEKIHSNRGVNGIDGQLSTFFGVCDPLCDNWALVGDLTAMYDMVAPWILPQLAAKSVNLVVINNGGGKIFKPIFKDQIFQNCHAVNFEGLAKMWSMDYERWESIPSFIENRKSPRLIELCPDNAATERFWRRWKEK